MEKVLHLENYILQNKWLSCSSCKHTFVRKITWSLAAFYTLINIYIYTEALSYIIPYLSRKWNLRKQSPRGTLINLSTSQESIWVDKTYTKEYKLCVASNMYVRATQLIFVKISRGTISSLTADCINQISKKPRWLWWQNELCIGGKKLRLIWSAVCFKGKESNPIRVI